MSTIYFLRHGKTAVDANTPISKWVLSDEGWHQAERVTETPEFQGKVIAALFADPRRMERTGQVFYAAELALQYGVEDSGGVQPPSHRAFLGDTPTFSAAVVE